MKKYVPYEKMSKKQKAAVDRERRGTWGGLNPVTRKSSNKTLYDRNAEKARIRRTIFYS